MWSTGVNMESSPASCQLASETRSQSSAGDQGPLRFLPTISWIMNIYHSHNTQPYLQYIYQTPVLLSRLRPIDHPKQKYVHSLTRTSRAMLESARQSLAPNLNLSTPLSVSLFVFLSSTHLQLFFQTVHTAFSYNDSVPLLLTFISQSTTTLSVEQMKLTFMHHSTAAAPFKWNTEIHHIESPSHPADAVHHRYRHHQSTHAPYLPQS